MEPVGDVRLDLHRVAEFVAGMYLGTSLCQDGLMEGQRLTTAVLGAAWAVERRGAEVEPLLLQEKERVMRAAEATLGEKVGIGKLKAALAGRGRKDLATAVGKLNQGRRLAAHPGQLEHEGAPTLAQSVGTTVKI